MMEFTKNLKQHERLNRLLPLKGIKVFDLSRLLPGGPAAYFFPPRKWDKTANPFFKKQVSVSKKFNYWGKTE
jgi:hypothetical protein